MVNQSLAHDGDGFKSTVGMAGKAGYFGAVVHAPAVLAAEVLPQGASCQGRIGSQIARACWVGVVVVSAEQKRVHSDPGKTKRLDLHNGAGWTEEGRGGDWHGSAFGWRGYREVMVRPALFQVVDRVGR